MRALLPGFALALGACAVAPPPAPPAGQELAQTSYERGIALREKGEHEGAIREFDEAIRLDPRNIEAYIDRGQSHRDRKQYEAAFADFDQAVRLDPLHARAYVNRGYTWYRLARHEQAIAEYDEAIRLGLKAHYERANAWQARGDTERALADFSEAIRNDPGFVLAYIGRGETFTQKGEYDRAIADYGEAIRLEPRAADAYYGRGGAWHSKRDYIRALADFTEVIRLAPFHMGAHGGMAWLLSTAPDPAIRDGRRAVDFARRACELYGWQNPYAIQTLAIAHAEASDYAEAIRWMEEAFKFPDFARDAGAEARERLALFREGKPYHEGLGEKPR
jgi:tetratricopeptide (TPR) repeat protein